MSDHAAGEARPFSVMSKPVGPRCNIDCAYCYYLDKEKLYPDERRFRMSETVLEAYVRQMIGAARRSGQKAVQFSWQGGEPTLRGLAFYETAVALQKQLCPEGMSIANGFQSNGLLIDDDWARFFARENFLIGVSVDGPREIHDRYRRGRSGKATFEGVMAGIDALRRAGAQYNILCTVHHGNAGKGREVYRFLRGLGTRWLQFIPVVERRTPAGDLAGAPQIDADPANLVTDWSVRPRAYGKFLCDVFDSWFRADVGKISVQFFDEQIALRRGLEPSLCILAETCGNALALEHNGDLYACDHYVYPEYRIGNILSADMEEMAGSERMTAFGEAKRDGLTAQCRRCSFRPLCNGGCPKHRFLTSKDGEAGQNYFCDSYTMFLRHAGERLGALAFAAESGMGAR